MALETVLDGEPWSPTFIDITHVDDDVISILISVRSVACHCFLNGSGQLALLVSDEHCSPIP